MEIHERELDRSLAELIRELLEEERQRVDSARYERQDELRDQIDARERELSDTRALEYLFEEHLTRLPAESRPRSFPERSRAYVEWEDSLRENLAAWNRELSDLDNRPIDGAAILNSAHDKLTSILSREAEVMGLATSVRKGSAASGRYSATPNSRASGYEHGDWIPLTELRPIRGQSPLALRLPSGEEISVNSWPGVLVESANWLVREGKFSEFDCPFVLGKSRLYFINRIPEHPDGQPFKTKRQMQNGMFIFTNYNSDQMVRNSARLLREFGGDPSRFYVKMR